MIGVALDNVDRQRAKERTMILAQTEPAAKNDDGKGEVGRDVAVPELIGGGHRRSWNEMRDGSWNGFARRKKWSDNFHEFLLNGVERGIDDVPLTHILLGPFIGSIFVAIWTVFCLGDSSGVN